MKSLKISVLISSLTFSLANPTFAETRSVAASTAAREFTAADTQRLFESEAAPLQLAALSETEMRETEGALIPVAVAGAMALGGLTNVSMYSYKSRQTTGYWGGGSSSGAAYAAGVGMLGGLISGVYSTAMLSTAGISTSLFARAAWTGGNQYGNAVIRTNGFALGHSWTGGLGAMPPSGCSYPCPNKN